MHFRGAGIGETDVNTARNQGPHQTFRTVHHSTPDVSLASSVINHPRRVSSKVSRTLLVSPRLAVLF
jgi:hypothetical protein